MRKPPGVTMWRNGALTVMPCSAAKMAVSSGAAKRRSITAPGHRSSRHVRPCSGSANRFNVIYSFSYSFSRRVMENDANRVTMARTETAHAVTQVDPIHPARALHRPMVDSEHDGVALHERDDFRP